MNTFIPPLLDDLVTGEPVDAIHQHVLKHFTTNTPLAEQVVSLNVWDTDKQLLYSTESASNRLHAAHNDDLEAAFNGQIRSRLIDSGQPETSQFSTNPVAHIHTYAPVRDADSGNIIAVVETYQNAEPLLKQVQQAQRQSWLVVAIATMVMYGLLFGLVHRASHTIGRQQAQLQQSVDDLTKLLTENRSLQQHLQTAAARTTEINEQFLHRIGRDLHDGPAQDLALALLRIDDLCPENSSQPDAIRLVLQSALHEIRTLAAGLQLPELADLNTSDVARRALRAFQRKADIEVDLVIDDSLPRLSLPKKIAIFRAITETLNNAYRHAEAKGIQGRLWATQQDVCLEITDNGPGFDLSTLENPDDHLGIIGLQQRIALLSGTFNVQSNPHTGTQISMRLPLEGDSHD
jgi:hypothetical protein